MNILITILQVIVGIAAIVAALASFVLFKSFRWPAAAFWGMKVFVSALSPILALVGLISLITGLVTASIWLAILGLYVTSVYAIHIYLVTEEPRTANGFKKFFPPQKMNFRLPKVPEPIWKKDIVYATVPESGRELLCDTWEPAASVPRSGLAFIFMHGSAFYFLDKDCGTRPFFRQLAGKGHVVMDIAYRLAPETDIMGMIHDVKRAVDWMREHSVRYGIIPDKIAVGGGSAGAHLALMAAYTIHDDRFTPPELAGKDLSVCGVVAEYPSADLAALYYHTNQHLTTREIPGQPKKKVPTEMPAFMKKRMGKDLHRLGLDKSMENIGIMAPLMGGHPDEVPEKYRFLSPVSHVDLDCPPTLLIHGRHDIMAPEKSSEKLAALLIKNKVPTVIHFLPQTDHAFDMALPGISPAAHTVIYEVGKFLALLVEQKAVIPKGIPLKPEEAIVY